VSGYSKPLGSRVSGMESRVSVDGTEQGQEYQVTVNLWGHEYQVTDSRCGHEYQVTVSRCDPE